ncbi:MAG: gliding motility lipoprotein GldH [Proteiniphilum sp.]|nr:gliding motility lipoprotein GldH [Proteiniphilum sp.]
MRTRTDILFFVAGALFSLLISCSEGEEYYRFHHIEKGKWYRDSTLIFTMDSLNISAGRAYDVTIEISSGYIYPYRNLWLRIDHNLADTLLRSDTLHYRLADEHGKWLGSGVGGLNQLSLPFLSSIPLYMPHLYRLTIAHVMSDDPLTGIEKVGLKVTEVHREEQ